MKRDELDALIKRVEAATGPDRELDAEIDVSLFGGEIIWKTANYTMEQYPASRRPSAMHVGGFVNDHVPLYTASLDAAVALVERELPGWTWTLDSASRTATLWRNNTAGDATHQVPAASLPLALILALLRAKQEQANDD